MCIFLKCQSYWSYSCHCDWLQQSLHLKSTISGKPPPHNLWRIPWSASYQPTTIGLTEAWSSASSIKMSVYSHLCELSQCATYRMLVCPQQYLVISWDWHLRGTTGRVFDSYRRVQTTYSSGSQWVCWFFYRPLLSVHWLDTEILNLVAARGFKIDQHQEGRRSLWTLGVMYIGHIAGSYFLAEV